LLLQLVVTPICVTLSRQGKDIHTATAAKVFNVDEADVTKEMRYKAKSVNFGIIYGQGAFGLSENLKISRGEAKEIIENYKKQFANIQQYMDNQMKFAQKKRLRRNTAGT
jgi:DNA polymerase-1